MFGWLFGKTEGAARDRDRVWRSDAARLKGIEREVASLRSGGGRSVVVVALTSSALDTLANALAGHDPVQCKDRFTRDSLRRRLGSGGSLTLALPAGLPEDVKQQAGAPPVDVLVQGRNDTRKADETILHFADQLGPGARVAFHLSFEDSLLRPRTGDLKAGLEQFRLPEDEAISHPWVDRAIANVQKKRNSPGG